MISVVCPYCGASACILFDPCMDELIRTGESKYTCDICKKPFNIHYGAEKIETKCEVQNESNCSYR